MFVCGSQYGMYRQHLTARTHKHTFFSAHFARDYTCGSRHFSCLRSHFVIGHVFAFHSFNPHGILWVLHETFFERPSAREGRTSTLFNNSSSSLNLGPDTEGNAKRPQIGMGREPQKFVNTFQSGAGVYDHAGGTCSHN